MITSQDLRFLQKNNIYDISSPLLFLHNGVGVNLNNLFKSSSAFLICSGPSLNTLNLRLLDNRGILTCAVNNAAAIYQPNLWLTLDDPANFCDGIWRDPSIFKFTPAGNFGKKYRVRDQDNSLFEEDEIDNLPAVFGFCRNEEFNPETFMDEPTFNWGNHAKIKDADGYNGARSVMYVAIRLLFYLGIRRLFLLGCDFKMNNDGPYYAFDQDQSSLSIRGNNKRFRAFNQRVSYLLPKFKQLGYQIFNCTKGSGLTIFPYCPFEEAISLVTSQFSEPLNTTDMYLQK